MFKKIDYIPEELKALLPQNKKTIVVIGNNAYEMYPIPLPKLPEILNDVLKLYENARKYKNSQQEKEVKEKFTEIIKELTTIKSILFNSLQKNNNDINNVKLEEISTTLSIVINGLSNILNVVNSISPIDIIGAPGNEEIILSLIKKTFVNIPDSDFENITPQQIMYIVNKAIEINSISVDEILQKENEKNNTNDKNVNDKNDKKVETPFPYTDKTTNN